MKKRNFWFFGILIMVLIISGCATRIGDFTLMTSKNVDLSRIGEFQRSRSNVKGSDSIITVLFFIPVKTKMDMKAALDNALSKIPGAVAIVDVRIDTRKLNFLLFQIESFVISGSALIDPNLAADTEGTGPYLVMDTTDGENFTPRYITEEEYNGYMMAVNNG